LAKKGICFVHSTRKWTKLGFVEEHWKKFGRETDLGRKRKENWGQKHPKRRMANLIDGKRGGMDGNQKLILPLPIYK
jgi:hypothetical protein